MRAEYYLGLVGGAAVIVPDGELLHVRGFLVQRLGLAPEPLPSPVNPNVERLHPAPIRDEYCDNQPTGDQYCNIQFVMFTQSEISISTINQSEIIVWF